MAPDNEHLISVGAYENQLTAAKGRLFTGYVIILFGVANIILPLVVLGTIEDQDYEYAEVEGIGVYLTIFGAVVLLKSILAGCLGIFSRERKGLIITYLVLCVWLAILTFCGCMRSSLITFVVNREVDYYFGVNLYNLLLINSVTNGLHCVAAIFGACFTCSSLCCTSNGRQTNQQMLIVDDVPGAIQQQVNRVDATVRADVGQHASFQYREMETPAAGRIE